MAEKSARAQADVEILSTDDAGSFLFSPPTIDWAYRAIDLLQVEVDPVLVLSQFCDPVTFSQTQKPQPQDIKDVQGDGSCLFRALAVMLLGSEKYHQRVRTVIADFIETDSEKRFFDFLGGKSGADYIAQSRMREQDVWGSDTEIAAAALLFGCNILVYDMASVHEQGKWKCFNAHLETGEPTLNVPSLLIYHPFNHFSAVLQISSLQTISDEETVQDTASTISNKNVINEQMRVAGYPGMCVFCEHPRKTTSCITIGQGCDFTIIDIIDGVSLVKTKPDCLHSIKEPIAWCDMHALRDAERTLVLALATECKTGKFYAILVEITKDDIEDEEDEESEAENKEEEEEGDEGKENGDEEDDDENGESEGEDKEEENDDDDEEEDENEDADEFVITFFNDDNYSAIIHDEHYLGIQANNTDIQSFFGELISDETGDLHCVILVQKEKRTTCHIVKLQIDKICSKISSRNVASNLIIDDLVEYPFIFDQTITFVRRNVHRLAHQLLSAKFEDDKIEVQYSALAPDIRSIGVARQYPEYDHRSNSCLYRNSVYYYFREINKKNGALWELELETNKWNKCFEFESHVIAEHAKLVVTSEGRLYLHGMCAEKNCQQSAHFYHFGVAWLGKFVFPSIQQLSALLSKTPCQIIHGPKKSGKSFVILLRAVYAFIYGSDFGGIKIFVSSNEQRISYVFIFFVYATAFQKIFNSENIKVLSEDEMNGEIFDENTVFIDELSSLDYEEKTLFYKGLKRNVIVALDQQDDDAFYGFNQPEGEMEMLSWHRLRLRENSCSSRGKKDNRHTAAETAKKKPKVDISQSLNAMDDFYKDWWSEVIPKLTVFIPACHDVLDNRYFGPTDPKAAGFDPVFYAQRSGLDHGQNAEYKLLNELQKLQIGGVFISGFNFKKCANILLKREDRKGISEQEVDAIFIHPLLGIQVFEVKATEEGEELKNIVKKAKAQLKKIKQQLLPLFLKSFNPSLINVPNYFTACFPNSHISSSDHEDDQCSIMDKSYFDNEEALLHFIKSKMNYKPQDSSDLSALKSFTAAIAAYRSLDYTSAGHNALAVHKLVVEQKFFGQKVQEPVFLTNEQLSVYESNEKHMIISGPPGTGKTLILLKRAFHAAQTKKHGEIYVITPQPELVYKFQKFFDKKTIRLPIILSEIPWSTLECDDDVYADELRIAWIDKNAFQKRQKHEGQTIIVLTGFCNLFEVRSVTQWLHEHNLENVHHISMTTVIRSSKSIFGEWQKEFSQNCYDIRLGHNVIGPNVQIETLRNSAEIHARVLEIVRELFDVGENKYTSSKISLDNLCIIADNSELSFSIASFLLAHQISCGTIQEQIFHGNIVAVSSYDRTLSFEWPIVIAVSTIHVNFVDQFLLIAASRCIAKLVVIQRDYEAVMATYDSKTEPIVANQEVPSMPDFFSAVKGVADENGETDTELISRDFLFHLVRLDYLPIGTADQVAAAWKQEILSENSHSLLNFCQLLVMKPALCRALLFAFSLVDLQTMIANGSFIYTEHPSSYFKIVTAGKWTTKKQDIFWSLVKQIARNLFDAVKNQHISETIHDTRDAEEIIRNFENIDHAFACLTNIMYMFVDRSNPVKLFSGER